MTPKFPISVIVLTFNEEKNIPACLESVDWAEDVIIVDSGSTDRTISAAQSTRPDVHIFERRFTDFGDQRNWALDNTNPRHEWILFLDADERCNSKCAQAIQAAVKNPGAYVGFFLTCKNFFLGRWIKRCTLYPSWQLRLLKKGYVRFQKYGHGQREIAEGPLGYIYEPYDHFGFSKGVAHWIERHNHYSTHEAELILHLRKEPLCIGELFSRDPVKRRRCLKRLAARLGILRPIARFVYLYCFRGGILEGRPGLLYCLLRFAHEVHIIAKLEEMRAN